MTRAKKSTPERCKSPFPNVLRALMSTKPATTQEKLAEITGKTRQTVSQYVNGISEPGYDTLIKIADYFNVSVDYLLGRTQDPSQKFSAIDDIGLSPAAAEWLSKMKEKNLSEEVCHLLEDPYFQKLVTNILDFSILVEAETISARVVAPRARQMFIEEGAKRRHVTEVDFYDKEMEKTISNHEGRIKQALRATHDFECMETDRVSTALHQVLRGEDVYDGILLSSIAKHRVTEHLYLLLIQISNHHLQVYDNKLYSCLYGDDSAF